MNRKWSSVQSQRSSTANWPSISLLHGAVMEVQLTAVTEVHLAVDLEVHLAAVTATAMAALLHMVGGIMAVDMGHPSRMEESPPSPMGGSINTSKR